MHFARRLAPRLCSGIARLHPIGYHHDRRIVSFVCPALPLILRKGFGQQPEDYA
jgi:hypothetical protein